MSDDDLYEALILFRAYQGLQERLGAADARDSDPADLIGKVAGYGHARAAAAIFADGYAPDLADAEHILGELLAYAGAGRRPRYGREIHPDFVRLVVLHHHEGATPS